MEQVLFNKFYLDKEKDIIVNLYKENDDELTYILETPNHNTGNLITNLAKTCGLETIKDDKDMKIIKGRIEATLNENNEEIYHFRLGGFKVATIYLDGRIDIKSKIPAIIKTLMSQTKDYDLGIKKTILKSHIKKKSKFRTDLHTHMHANLTPDELIALGIKHQVRYSLYYVRKLDLKLTNEQERIFEEYRREVEAKFENGDLQGKLLDRKIKDETYINFADLILNNLENAEENINKIRKSLVILKDSQAVFTNLEKVYVYRYAFSKGKISKKKIKLESNKINLIPDKDIVDILNKMMEDSKPGSVYADNNLSKDKLLWVAREYQKQGIKYAEIATTTLTKNNGEEITFLEEVHDIMPQIEKETGVLLRFLVGIRRVWLTPAEIRSAVDVLKAVAKSPYVVGSDIIGEEINDIEEFEPVIKELVQYAIKENNGFTVRIHAGENDCLSDNVRKSIECVKKSLRPGQKAPKVRIGHGLYGGDLNSFEGKTLIRDLKEMGAVLEFQLTSNVRLNNLTSLDNHPIKVHLAEGVSCVQGTDGCGLYGSNSFDEQIALTNLLELTDVDFLKMRKVEDRIIKDAQEFFEMKSKDFEKLRAGRSIKETLLELEAKSELESKNSNIEFKFSNNISSTDVMRDKIKSLPDNKVPIIIAGGSFNTKGRETIVTDEGMAILRALVERVNENKAYFVVGHKMQGYEKALMDISKELDKNFEIDAIIPKMITQESEQNLKNTNVGICVSIEPEEQGIYKSFNYEIFERRNSVVVAFDGNSPVSNLVQEAKNGKGKAKIYVNNEVEALRSKANSLGGYVIPFGENIVDKILEDNPEIKNK